MVLLNVVLNQSYQSNKFYMQPIHTITTQNNKHFRTYHNLQLTNLPTLESSLSPRTHPRAEITSQNRSTPDLPRSSLFKLIFPQKHVSNSASRIAGCFLSCLAQASHLGLFKAILCFSSAFPAFLTSSQLLSSSLGKFRFFLKL